MKRTEFPRVTPESLGISSAHIEALLDKLEEGGFSEPHSLIIMRHGRICAEGWWAPYTPGMRHAMMSHTKTYAGTAVGIAITEGLVGLDDRLVDIFPELVSDEPSEHRDKLLVRHVLSMASGMRKMPDQGLDWVRDYLNNHIDHEPGSTFIYSSMCEMLGAIVRKVTGQGMREYLKPRLFDKLGISTEGMVWLRKGDGCEFSSAGMQMTTEDNLRLMKLYADGGVWEGERILSEEFVRLATTQRMDNRNNFLATPKEKAEGVGDGLSGYGFMMWMCKRPLAYRADGFAGQFTVVMPDLDMILSVTENASDANSTLDAIWEFAAAVEADTDPLHEDPAAVAHLCRRMARLALPAEPYAPISPKREVVNGVEFKMASGCFTPGMFSFGPSESHGVTRFRLDFTPDTVTMDYHIDGKHLTALMALDGSYRRSTLDGEIRLLSAHWAAEDTLRTTWRPSEGLFTYHYDFKFTGTRCDIIPLEKPLALPGVKPPEPIWAIMV